MTGKPIDEDDLQAYVDEALDERRSSEVDAWLVGRPDERARIEGYRRDRAALRAALDPIAAESVPERLSVRKMKARRRQPGLRWPLPLATSLLLTVMGGGAGWLLRGTADGAQAGAASLAREASQSYVVYATDRRRPVEVGADSRQMLVDWGSDRLNRRIVIPDLSRSGYSFLGGRMVATPHGPAVMAMYDRGAGERLAILVRDMKIDRDAPMTQRSEDGFGVVTWARDGVGYGLVGLKRASDLLPIARRAQTQID